MLSAAVEAGVDDKAIGLQANWKDPGPLVLKYARKRKDLSVGMVRNLAAQLREQWKPDPEEFTVEDRDGHRGTGSDRVRAQEQRVGSQDHGR